MTGWSSNRTEPSPDPQEDADRQENKATQFTSMVSSPNASSTRSRAEAAERGRQARLVVERGPGAGVTYALTTSEVEIGRHPDCEIVLDDFSVSRHHATICRDDQDRYWASDLGSLNGVYINRRRVDTGELRDADEMWIGNVRFTFRTAR